MIRYLLPALWLAWGLSYPMMAWSLEAVDMFTTRLIVMPLSGIALLLFQYLSGERSLLPSPGFWPGIAVTAMLNMTLFQLFLIAAIFYAGPGKTSILVYTMPLWSAAFAFLLMRERLRLRTAISLALGMVAVVLIAAGDLSTAASVPLGVAFGLMAAISFGLGTVLMKRISWRDDLTTVAAWQLILGSGPVIIVWLVFRQDAYVHWNQVHGLLALVYLSLIANAVAYFCWFRIINVLPVTIAGLTTLVVPCVGVFSSAMLTDYRLQAFDFAALVLVMISVALVLFRMPARTADVEVRS